MKRTPLKKKSKNPRKALQDRADRALQDWYREEFNGKKCDGCGVREFELMHHFFEKSQSAFLRFNDKNLIFLCSGCHYRHHRTGDASIHGSVIARRGIKWFRNLEKLKLGGKGFQHDIKSLEYQLKKYKI